MSRCRAEFHLKVRKIGRTLNLPVLDAPPLTVRKPGWVLSLIDLDGPVSITNDAENVIDELLDRGFSPDNCRIIYRDTEGRWDGLAWGVAFVGFVSLGAKTEEEAIELALAHRAWR